MISVVSRVRRWFEDDSNYWGVVLLGMSALGPYFILRHGAIGPAGWPHPIVCFSPLWGLSGLMMLFSRRGQQLARLLGSVALLNTAVMTAVLFHPLRLSVIGYVVMAGLLLWEFRVHAVTQPQRNASRRSRRDQEETGESSANRSIVLLLREPLYLDASVLARLAGQAFGLEFRAVAGEDAPPEDQPGDRWGIVGGDAPHFMVFCSEAALAVHVLGEPYAGDPDESARSITDLRTRKAVEQHRAWVSVDLIHSLDGDDSESTAYRRCGRLAAELYDDNCVAVYLPQFNEVFAVESGTDVKLRSDDPAGELRGRKTDPIVGIPDGDEELRAAAAEALRRWPEFMAEFEAQAERPDPTPCFVKFPFRSGDAVEYMWLRVTSVENGVVFGVLNNDPGIVEGYRIGQSLQARVSELNDWMIASDSGIKGGFTVPRVAQVGANQQQA